MIRELASRGVILAAVMVLFAGRAYADDVLLLKDGGQKRGKLASCDQRNCRIGAETVPRAQIEWIGLDRDAPAPAVRDPTRDELHLVNRTVQSVTLNGVDAGFVHTTLGGQGFSAASSLPRGSVAWIYFGLPKQSGGRDTLVPPPERQKGKEKEKQATQTKGKDQDAANDRSVLWRFPPRLYIAVPAPCTNCQATLHVLDLKTEDDMIVMEKYRVISASWNWLTGDWFRYDPPVPLFPATTDVERFSFEGRLRTNVTHHSYNHHTNRQPGGMPSRPAPSSPGPKHDTADSQALGKMFSVPGVASPEDISTWWQDRLEDEWKKMNKAAKGAGAGGGTAGGCEARQNGVLTGEATYTHTLRIENWPLMATEIASLPGPQRSSYEKLRSIEVYDIEFDLRFDFGDHGGRGRDRGTDCYTTDWVKHDSRGPRMPAPDGIPIARSPRPRQEEPDTSTPLDWLFGRQAQSVREGMEKLNAPVDAARQAIGGVRDDLAKGRRNFEDSVRNAMSGGGILGDGSSSPQSGSSASGPPHSVTLHARWFRRTGRVTEYLGDIIAHAVEGQHGRYSDITISSSRPPGVFDMLGPEGWPAANPKPPPPKSNFNWRP